jgi:hypothetical protein
MGQPWEELRDSIVETVKGRAKDFIAKNADAEKLLKDRAERLAKLAFLYTSATNEETRKILAGDMATVRLTIENDIMALEVAAQAEARSVFKVIVGTSFEIVLKTLPLVD